jgi:type VI secretion system protein ImpE
MNSEGLLREGKLDEAVQALSELLRENLRDSRSRTFLFELLCFRGDYERAAKHLALLAEGGKDAAAGALLYQAALHAEELRAEMFRNNAFPGPLGPEDTPVAGMLNGKPFTDLRDADERIGARLEVFAGADYLWVPLRHVASLEMQPPKRLRDLLWAPGILRMGPAFGRPDLGEVLLPALSPLTFQNPDPEVRLGRRTEWLLDEQGRETVSGQKVLIVNAEEISFLEIRTLEIGQVEAVGR